MLPKEEKVKKNPDLDQPGLFDKENEKERITKKRRFVYIAMSLTIGLSLSFWLFRSLKNFTFSFPKPNLKISLPSLNLKRKEPELDLDSNSTWVFFVQDNHSNTPIFQKNQDLLFVNQDFDFIVSQLDQSDFSSSNQFSSLLPQGVKVKEIIEENDNHFSYFSKIITPGQELILIIAVKDSLNLVESKNKIPDLVNQLYWYSLQK